MCIERYTRNNAGIFRTTSLYDSISISRVWRAQNGKWNPTVPEHGPGHLPAVYGGTEHSVPHLHRQLVNVLRGEIVPDIVVARAVLTPEVSRQRLNDPASGERQKCAVG